MYRSSYDEDNVSDVEILDLEIAGRIPDTPFRMLAVIFALFSISIHPAPPDEISPLFFCLPFVYLPLACLDWQNDLLICLL